MTAPHSFERPRKIAILLMISTFLGLTAAAAFAPIDSAVVAPGTVKVEGRAKEVQHPEGGIVAALPVRDGDLVKAGDLVLRLDARELKADLAALEQRLIELSLRRARLVAERDGAEMVPPAADRRPAYHAEVLADETRLLHQRRESVAAQLAQLSERISQLASEAEGQSAQLSAAERARGFLADELADLRALQAKELVPLTRLRALEREGADLDGNIGALTAEIARTKGRRSELEMQIRQLTQDSAITVLEELRRVETEVAEITRKIVAAEARLSRAALYAPVSGRVHEAALHTEGGVLGAGATAMLIVPEDDRLVIELRLSPQDIDQVQSGQRTRLRLSAFNQRVTPEIEGVVSHVPADLTTDPQTGANWYALKVTPDAAQIETLGDLRLKPGMPAEAILLGQSRTFLSYLVKPMADHLTLALREE